MTTNTYPGIGYKKQGKDFNFFRLVTVQTSTFGGQSDSGTQPDIIITFSTKGLMFINYGSGATNTIEYSFNGTTVHGELVPGTDSASLSFDNRVASLVWFRLKQGSSGSVVLHVQAWG